VESKLSIRSLPLCLKPDIPCLSSLLLKLYLHIPCSVFSHSPLSLKISIALIVNFFEKKSNVKNWLPLMAKLSWKFLLNRITFALNRWKPKMVLLMTFIPVAENNLTHGFGNACFMHVLSLFRDTCLVPWIFPSWSLMHRVYWSPDSWYKGMWHFLKDKT